MDYFLSKVTQQAMNYAIRSGVSITAAYAIRQSTKLINNIPKSDIRDELSVLQQRLEHKIRIVSPAIDLIDLIAARGNTSLESAVSLTKDLRLEIQSLGQRFAQAAKAIPEPSRKTKLAPQAEFELTRLAKSTQELLDRIEDAVPLINLAITTSGASLSTSLPHTVSPSRLLQASTLLTAGDTQYTITPRRAVQVGPTFTLTIYMLFAGHDRPQNEEDIRETTWKEVIHKAKLKLRRVPLDVVVGTGSGSSALAAAEIGSPGHDLGADADDSIRADARIDEYAYQLMIIEDFDDDRVHTFEDDETCPGPFDDVQQAGIREMIPVHEISKIFYADTSKVLNIGSDAESNHPVLLLKRDLNAIPPRRMAERQANPEYEPEIEQELEETVQQSAAEDVLRDPWRFPPSLDPEWIAFEVYAEAPPSDSDSELDEAESSRAESATEASRLADSLSQMHINSPSTQSQIVAGFSSSPQVAPIKTSLSLLELLLRLTSLQQFQQQSHLAITDELLNFFLEESAATGAGGDENYRQTLRADARRRVGWDPYDESPLKRRGEEYQFYSPSPRASPAPGVNGGGSRTWSPAVPQAGPGATVSDLPGSSSPSPSPLPLDRARGGRTSWLKREERRKSSPLRPQTALTDEGIGSSPASGIDKPSL